MGRVAEIEDKVITTFDDECWLWAYSISPDGYGKVSINARSRTTAHRLAYITRYGDYDTKVFQLDHLCKVRNCWNPEHLELVTPKENVGRSISHNREKTHCIRGHELVPPFAFIREDGRRQCKVCCNIQRGRSGNVRGRNPKSVA